MAACSRQMSTASSGHGYETSEDESSGDEDLRSNDQLAQFIARRGLYEIEICEDGEAGNIQDHVDNCKKNPGHHQFHHALEFAKRHLPERFKDRELFRAIKTCAELTVNIFLWCVSPERPEFFLKSSKKYPYHGKSGERVHSRGTGWVWKVEKYGEGSAQKSGPCRCRDCEYSPNPEKVWWEIIILTATHVVFDKNECETTTVTFWDEKDSKQGKLRLHAHAMGDSSVEADRGMFTCITHDQELCKYLITRCIRRSELIKKCDDKYRHDDFEGLTVVVSHPHGDQKRITLGTGLDRDDEELASRFLYNTPTCKGSSGGFVWAVGWGSSHGSVALHSEGDINETNKNENRSGWSWPL